MNHKKNLLATKYYVVARILLLINLPLLMVVNNSVAQSKLGISIAPGIGYVYSPTLNKIQNSNIGTVPMLTESSASKGAGFNLGVGMYYQYTINNKFAILTDPTFNILNSKIYMNSKFESMDNNGSGTQSRFSSTAKITTMYVQVPVVLKYTFFEKRKLYLIAGGAVNIMLPSTLKSEEHSTLSVYGYERLTSTVVMPTTTISTTIDKYNPIQIAAVVGFGRQFRKGLNHVSLDIRYNHPLLSSTFYSTSSDLSARNQNNLFSQSGQQASEVAKPQFSLNDFTMGVFNLTLRYTLKKFDKSAPKKEPAGASTEKTTVTAAEKDKTNVEKPTETEAPKESKKEKKKRLADEEKNDEVETPANDKAAAEKSTDTKLAESETPKESKKDKKKRLEEEELEKSLPVRP